RCRGQPGRLQPQAAVAGPALRRGDGYDDPPVVAQLVVGPGGGGPGAGLVLSGVRAEGPGHRRNWRGIRGRGLAAADATRLLNLAWSRYPRGVWLKARQLIRRRYRPHCCFLRTTRAVTRPR